MDIHDPKSHDGDGQAAAAAATASAAGSGAGDGEDPLECSSDNEFTLSDKSLSGTDSDTDSTIVYLYRSQTPAATSTSLQSPSSQRREEEEACSDPREEITDWCACGKCIPTSNILNCKCCLDFQEIQDRVLKFCKGYGDGKKIRCITQHDGFRSLCLDPWVLETAYYQYRQEYPYDAESAQDQAQKYRNIAYRQFVRWTFGWLGRHKRVLLPSCVMKAIRDSFPNEDGTYAGFKYE